MKKSIIAAAVVAAAGISTAAASEVFAAEDRIDVTEDTTGVSEETSSSPVLGQTPREASETGSASDENDPGKTDPKNSSSDGDKDQENPSADAEGKTDQEILQPGNDDVKPAEKPGLTETVPGIKPADTVVGQITVDNNKYNIVETKPSISDGWYKEGDSSFYYKNGETVKGVCEIEGSLYFFDSTGKLTYGQTWFNNEAGEKDSVCSDLKTGVLFTGLFELTEEYNPKQAGTVYFNDKGLMQFGALSLNNNNYFFDLNTGVMYKNQFGDNKDCYYGKDGAMVYGQQNIEGNWYCFDHSDGKMKTGMTYLDESYQSGESKWVYYQTDGDKKGVLVSGLQKIDGKLYYFDEYDGHRLSNVLKTAVVEDKNGTIYLGKDGAAVIGEAYAGGQWRYFGKDCLMVVNEFVSLTKDGHKTDQDKTVYYDENGVIAGGQKKINGNWYCFDLYNGAMKKGFTYLDERYQPGGAKTVYYNEDGILLYGFQNIDGDLYYFGPVHGDLTVNKMMDYEVDDKKGKVYFGSDGKAAKGQANTGDGNWRYFDKNTCLMVTGFRKLTVADDHSDTDKYVFYDEEGRMVYGQKNINGFWYCFDLSNGAMFTGRKELDKRYQPDGAKAVYYSEKDSIEEGRGQLQTGEIIVNDKIFYADPFNGALQDNYAKEIDGKLYFYNTYGDQKRNAQIHYNNAWYYAGEDGQFVKNTLINLTKEQNNGGAKTVYYGADGVMVYGMLELDGQWKYFKPESGAMARNELVSVAKNYNRMNNRDQNSLFDENGNLVKQAEYTLNGSKYKIDPTTYEAKLAYPSWLTIRNGTVIFDPDGYPTITAPENSKLGKLLIAASTNWNIKFTSGGRDNDTNLDCIGFVMRTYNKAFGIHLQASSVNDFVTSRRYGYYISESALQPGDIVTYRGTWTPNLNWYTHSSIYLGNGLVMYVSYGGPVIGPMRGVRNYVGGEAGRQPIRIDV